MIASLVLFIILDVDTFASIVLILIVTYLFFIFVLIRLKTSLGLEVAFFGGLCAEAGSGLAHLIEEIVAAPGLALARLRIIVVVEYLLVLSAFLVLLQ